MLTFAAQASPRRTPYIKRAMMRMMDLRIETSQRARHIQHGRDSTPACRLCRGHANITASYGAKRHCYRRIELPSDGSKIAACKRFMSRSGVASAKESYCPVSKLHCAPPPAFCMISFGSIVHRNLEMLSMLEPAAPSEGMPAAAIVAPTSLASRPVSVRLRAPKLSSQLREVMSTLLTRQITVSASTEIFVLGVKPKLVLPRNSRAMTRLSDARTAGECCAITAAKAKALGPLALPGAADAVLCTMVSAKATIKAGMISVFIGATSIRDTPALGDLAPTVLDRC